MNCPKCNRENEESAMYCRYCGSPMHQKEIQESNISSILILIWIISKCIVIISTSLITKLVDEWYFDSSTKMIYYGIAIVGILFDFLPAFAIKNKTLKIVGIIITSIWVIWTAVQFVTTMLE